ncbi:MAG TPA: recombinase family protein [Bacilli bacterium]|nr:recombinase family protein [Bacilli bacterium]
MIYGYTRVSTKKQLDGYGLETQRIEITQKYPDAIIVKEQYTGTKLNRPLFKRLIKKLEPNDILVVSKLDRFARNTVEGIKVVENLFHKKIAIHILNIGLLEDTPMGRFFLTTMLAVAELERNTIIERTQTGKELARLSPNYREGRPPKYSHEELTTAIDLLITHTYKEVVELTGISKSSIVRARKAIK